MARRREAVQLRLVFSLSCMVTIVVISRRISMCLAFAVQVDHHAQEQFARQGGDFPDIRTPFAFRF